MTKEIQNPNSEIRKNSELLLPMLEFRISSFGIPSGFVIRISDFGNHSSFGFVSLPEHNNVLAWQNFDRFDPFEWLNGHLLAHLGFGHFVHRLDGNLRIFTAEFDKNHAAPWLERGTHRSSHLVRIIEFMINIDHQNQIDGSSRQLRIINCARDWLHITELKLGNRVCK